MKKRVGNQPLLGNSRFSAFILRNGKIFLLFSNIESFVRKPRSLKKRLDCAYGLRWKLKWVKRINLKTSFLNLIFFLKRLTHSILICQEYCFYESRTFIFALKKKRKLQLCSSCIGRFRHVMENKVRKTC